MPSRGIIKWQPFDNFGSTKTIIGGLNKERAKVKMPVLSDEQINNINDKISWYYDTKKELIVEYYLNGYICQSKGIIQKIDILTGYLKVNNDIIYFKQIINIK